MVTACIVLFNNSSFIQGIFSTLIQESKNIDEIIFFDNNSNDDSLIKLEILINKQKKTRLIQKIRIIKNRENIGFSKAINICIKKSHNSNILLLNPDAMLYPGSLDNLLKFYSINNAAIVGGKFINYNNDTNANQKSAVRSVSFIDCLLVLTNLGKLPFFRSLNNEFWERETIIKEVVGVTGGYMLFAKKIYFEIGGFDESYWMYLEDLDFCIRAKKKGYKVYFVPTAKLKHYGGGSSIEISKYRYNKNKWFKSRDIFFKKNYTVPEYLIFKFISIFEQIILTAREVLKFEH